MTMYHRNGPVTRKFPTFGPRKPYSPTQEKPFHIWLFVQSNIKMSTVLTPKTPHKAIPTGFLEALSPGSKGLKGASS